MLITLAYEGRVPLGWLLLALWILGTVVSVALIFTRARVEQRPLSARLLFERRPRR